MTHRVITAEAINKTAAGLRAHLASQGVEVSHEQMRRRVIKAQEHQDNIPANERK